MQYVFPTSVFLAPRSLMGLGGGGGVGSKVGGRFFLVAAAAVDIRLLMKGALHFAPAAEVGRRLTQTVQRPGGSGGNTAAARTWPRRDLQKTRDMCSLSVIARLGLLLMCGRCRRHCLCFSRSYVLGNGRDFQAICRQALISAHVWLFANKGNRSNDKTSKLWWRNRLFGDHSCIWNNKDTQHQEETYK